MFKPRHSKVNRRQWVEAKRRYQTAMEDGRIDPHEHLDILAAFDAGDVIGDVCEAADALGEAVNRATDPDYIMDLTRVYLAKVERLPEIAPAA